MIFGKVSFGADVDLASFSTGVDGFKIAGVASSQLGQSVSGAGDVNGDGFDDLIFGAPMESPSSRSNAGAAYVIFGKSTTYTDFAATSFTSGADGFQIIGLGTAAQCGNSVRIAGDYNADGYDDVIVGSPGARSFAGNANIIFGKASTFSAIDLLTFTSGTAGQLIRDPNRTSSLPIL